MTKRYLFGAIASIFMMLALLTSCGDNADELVFTSAQYPLADGTSFEYVQILSGMEEDQKDNVNEALRASATEWIMPEYCWLADCKWDVVFQSSEYITVCYSFDLHYSNRISDDQYRLYTTIHLGSGQIMFLDDFMEDEELFVQQVCSKFPESTRQSIQDICRGANTSVDEYFSQLVSEFDPLARQYPISYLVDKPEFYLVDGGVGIKYSENAADDIFFVDGIVSGSIRGG